MGITDLNEEFPVYLDEKLARKIQFLSEYKDEWAGYGVGELRDLESKKVLWIDNILIPPQTVSGAEAELDPESDKWVLKNHPDQIDRIVCHLHSHNTMSAFYSAGDEKNHEKLISGRKFMIFLVVAKAKEEGKLFEYVCKLAYKNKNPFGGVVYAEMPAKLEIMQDSKGNPELKKLQVKFEKIKVEYDGLKEKIKEIETNEFKEIKDECETILKERVKSKVYTSVSGWDWESHLGIKSKSEGGKTIWRVEKDDLTIKEVELINKLIQNTPDFDKLEILVDKYETKGENLVNVCIVCPKKKIAQQLDKAINKEIGTGSKDNQFKTSGDLQREQRDNYYKHNGDYFGGFVNYGYGGRYGEFEDY